MIITYGTGECTSAIAFLTHCCDLVRRTFDILQAARRYSDTVPVTVNGDTIEVPKGVTVLQVGRQFFPTTVAQFSPPRRRFLAPSGTKKRNICRIE